jgi:hypothetical protein
MKFASSVFAALGLNAALLADVAAPAAASDSDVYPPTEVKVARSNQAGDEETPAATSAQQHLRRANVFNSSNGNVNIIVVLKDDGRRRRNLTGNGQETAAEKKAAAEENKAAAAAAAASMGAVATFTYGGAALFGFAASVPPGQRKQIEEDPRVDYVEDDATVQLSPIEMGGDRRRLPGKPGGGGDPAQTTPWGISRVKGGASNQDYGTAWVLDTGIDLDHPDLNVDVANSESFAGQSPNDEHGHGMLDLLLMLMFFLGIWK